MIVIYGKANRLSLPYANEQGNIAMFNFTPGKNEIDPKIWDAIEKMHSQKEVKDKDGKVKTVKIDKWDLYKKHFNLEAKEATRRGDVGDLDETDFIEVIKATNTIEELDNYEKHENEKGKGEPRKEVFKAIGSQRKKVQKVIDDIEKKKNKKKK